jgi:hypothetical protein
VHRCLGGFFVPQEKKRRNNWFIPSIFDAAGRKIRRAEVCSKFISGYSRRGGTSEKPGENPGAPTGKGAKNGAFAFGGQPAGLKTGEGEYSYYTGMPKTQKNVVFAL